MKIGGIIGGVVVLLILFVLGGAFYTVEETERGILIQNGAIVSETPIGPGLNFKLPIIQGVDTISVASSKESFPELSAGTSDLQSALLSVSVNYRIPDAEVVRVRRQYITEQNLLDRVLRPKVLESVKSVFSRYKAEDAIRQRDNVTTAIIEDLTAAINGPIIIESIQIEDIRLNPAFMDLIEDKANQTLRVQTLEQIEQQKIVEARTTVVNAQAQADATLNQSRADAEAIRLRGEAEAYAIEVKAKALAQNQNLVELTKAENWNGVLPTTMLPNTAVPFIDATPKPVTVQ